MEYSKIYKRGIRDIRESQSQVSLRLRFASLKWFENGERMGDKRQVRRIKNEDMEGKILGVKP